MKAARPHISTTGAAIRPATGSRLAPGRDRRSTAKRAAPSRAATKPTLSQKAGSSALRYYEVTNAQHFDTFIDLLPGYDNRIVPLHVYFNQALDLMYAHLKTGAPLPASQVVHTTPRGGTAGSAPAISASNVPPIATSPAAADAIGYAAGTVSVPD